MVGEKEREREEHEYMNDQSSKETYLYSLDKEVGERWRPVLKYQISPKTL